MRPGLGTRAPVTDPSRTDPRAQVAYMTLSLVDDRATFVNGAIVNVDGGLLANNALLPMKLPGSKL